MRKKIQSFTRVAWMRGTPAWKISHASTYAQPQMSMMVP
jgi:hypothetical protein